MRILGIRNSYWFLIFLILYSGNGISFFNRNIYPIATFLLLGICVYRAYLYKISLKGFLLFLIGWGVYCIINFLAFRAFHPLFLVLFPTIVLSSYVLLNSHRNLRSICAMYEKIIFYLAIISLVFYFWQTIDISSLISLFSLFDLNSGESYNAVVYTIHHKAVDGYLSQNSGFCWEPGPFSCSVGLALIIRLLRKRFTMDLKIVLFVVTIVTTISTTGYLTLLLIFGWLVYRYSKRYFWSTIPLALLLIIYIFNSTNNLGIKILPQLRGAQDSFEFYSRYGRETSTSIGRFDGFLLNLEDFKRYPVMGYGGHFQETFSQRNGLRIYSTSGLGNWVAQFGLVGVLFLAISLYKSSFFLAKTYNCKEFGFIIWALLIFIFAFNILYSPIFSFFVFMGNFKYQRSQ